MTPSQDNLRRDRAAMARELELAGAEFHGNECRCPFHEDQRASAGIFQGQDGVWRFKCQAQGCGVGGDIYDIRAKIQNRTLAEVLREADQGGSAPRPPGSAAKAPTVFASIEAMEAVVPGKIEARYTYTNPRTKTPDLVVIRYLRDDGKHFWQASPVDGGWILKRPQGQLPLYNRIHMATTDAVMVVEGEKCVHAIRSAGYIGTTSPMGAGKASYADWSPLAGKTCYLWADNDEPGIMHMQQVAEILQKLDPAPKVYWIDPKDLDLPPKGDAVDFLAKWEPELARSAIQTVIEMAAPMACEPQPGKAEAPAEPTTTVPTTGAAALLQRHLDRIKRGVIAPVPWPWARLNDLAAVLLPGAVVVFAGSPGASKSLAALQCTSYWVTQGIRCALLCLEGAMERHLTRLLSQLEENASITSWKWVKENPDAVDQASARHAAMIDRIGPALETMRREHVTHTSLAAWIKAKGKDGCRVAVVDPISVSDPGSDRQWVADKRLITSSGELATEYGMSVILVSHPAKNAAGISLDSLCGGAAFQRHVDAVLWLQFHEVPRTVTMASPCGRFEGQIDRTLHILKANDSPGQGKCLGFVLDKKSLTLAEQGLIIREPKPRKESSE